MREKARAADSDTRINGGISGPRGDYRSKTIAAFYECARAPADSSAPAKKDGGGFFPLSPRNLHAGPAAITRRARPVSFAPRTLLLFARARADGKTARLDGARLRFISPAMMHLAGAMALVMRAFKSSPIGTIVIAREPAEDERLTCGAMVGGGCGGVDGGERGFGVERGRVLVLFLMRDVRVGVIGLE